MHDLFLCGHSCRRGLDAGHFPAPLKSLAFPSFAVPGRISAQTSLYHLSATALTPPQIYSSTKHHAKKGAPPGALLSGKQLTIVLAAFTAVLQMSCRHLFFLTDPLFLLFPLLRHLPSLLGHSVHLILPILPFPLSHQRISWNHRCMWLYR